jgi:hypothetical protein
MEKGRMTLGSLGVLLLLCVIASQARAQSFILTKIADLNTPIPGGSGNFNLPTHPVINFTIHNAISNCAIIDNYVSLCS